MEFLANLGITSPLGLLGFALLVIGGFLILTGTGIITIQQVTVKEGRKTWVVGLLMVVVSVFLLYPELSNPNNVSEGAAPVMATNEGTVVDTNPTARLSTSVPKGSLSDWKAIEFVIPGNNFWLIEDGRYTAVGSKDTIAWSEDIFTGDIELTFEVESSVSFSAANIILYGNGGSLSKGNLIFTIASDQQSILADSIYGDGNYLFSSLGDLSFGEQKHTVLISVVNRKASLFLDGEEITSIILDETINTSGKIGLMKYWEIKDVTFSNIRVRE